MVDKHKRFQDTMSDKAKFTFQLLPNKQFPSLEHKDSKENWLKWSMHGRIQAQCFSFDQPFQSYEKDTFVAAFVQDPAVYTTLKVCSSDGKVCTLGLKPTSVDAEHVPCSVLSMGMFDRLYENPIVRENGQLHKCFDEFYVDITISDELRKMLLLEDSDYYDIYSEDERSEFLFRLFKHICIGGAICQYEDTIQPYLNTTKAVYKDLVSVQKDSSTGELHVTSTVFKISAKSDDMPLYPASEEHEQSFAYLVVDPLKRHVSVLAHQFGASNFDS